MSPQSIVRLIDTFCRTSRQYRILVSASIYDNKSAARADISSRGQLRASQSSVRKFAAFGRHGGRLAKRHQCLLGANMIFRRCNIRRLSTAWPCFALLAVGLAFGTFGSITPASAQYVCPLSPGAAASGGPSATACGPGANANGGSTSSANTAVGNANASDAVAPGANGAQNTAVGVAADAHSGNIGSGNTAVSSRQCQRQRQLQFRGGIQRERERRRRPEYDLRRSVQCQRTQQLQHGLGGASGCER